MSSLTFWLMVGFLGQAFFTARFLVQWVVSERKRDSVVPVAFWWLSLLGGAALLSYAIFRRDPVIIAGQGMGLVVYTRNLMLVGKARRRVQAFAGCSARLIRQRCSHGVPRMPGPAADRRPGRYRGRASRIRRPGWPRLRPLRAARRRDGC